ncbi:hypothetical protein N7532_005168 [Penicillium argentinense]|uniref:Myb-like DNA-binding domain-containing protein n=1 Tax=Penicillium argentinense TaxID=1131581 RepID=A0A9W9FDZ6_9EURO|nr:uncharacterized protein N7532_005168 [Penicillium argentinense]KAJ5098167.1 hypothetical protein N7532_005168 [Penicillium argentinense]
MASGTEMTPITDKAKKGPQPKKYLTKVTKTKKATKATRATQATKDNQIPGSTMLLWDVLTHSGAMKEEGAGPNVNWEAVAIEQSTTKGAASKRFSRLRLQINAYKEVMKNAPTSNESSGIGDESSDLEHLEEVEETGDEAEVAKGASGEDVDEDVPPEYDFFQPVDTLAEFRKISYDGIMANECHLKRLAARLDFLFYEGEEIAAAGGLDARLAALAHAGKASQVSSAMATDLTILLRADMEALPLEEKTGLPYASARHVKDADGVSKPISHACGHDSHVTSLMTAATLLHAAREYWTGTLICISQPSEEHLDGARAMLDGGLYSKIPMPDVVLAQHVMRMRAGTVHLRAGRFLTAADAFDVRVFGRGGHGSSPQTTIDPIVIGASIVTKLQTIVSREVVPGEVAVLNVRTFDPRVSERVCAAIHRVIEAECRAGGAVEKPRIVRMHSTPATVNDAGSVDKLRASFESYFQNSLVEIERPSACEDFSLLATAVGAPYVMWMFGGIDEETWDGAVAKGTVNELPSNHSPFFAPAIQPGVYAMAVAALTFLRK